MLCLLKNCLDAITLRNQVREQQNCVKMLNKLASKEKTSQCSAVNVVNKALMTSLTDYQTMTVI